MGKAAADIGVATVVGQLDQQLPGGVVGQLDGEHGVQGLGQVGARIGNDLQRSGTQYPGQVGAGSLGGRVGAEGLDCLDQQEHVGFFIVPDLLECGNQLRAGFAGGGLGDQGLVQAYAGALIGQALAQLIDQHFRVVPQHLVEGA